jgi:RNase H-fold protein (predicted Holliday junction resolvase)
LPPASAWRRTPLSESVVVAVDPGRDKCGLAVVRQDLAVLEQSIVSRSELGAAVRALVQRHRAVGIVMGNRTGSSDCRSELARGESVPIVLVEEHGTTERARARYFEMNPPRGLAVLVPRGLRVPPRPVDDYAAVLLAEAYWEGQR